MNTIALSPVRVPTHKRLMDISLSSLAIVALSPVLAAIAAAIKLGSPGPVLFTQWRAGAGGVPFRIYKFRTMVQDAENLKAQLANERDGPVFKMRRDPRVTRVGHFLRKYALDELPQLFNILRGDMSIVGPRPATLDEVERYTHYQCVRLRATPGLTCIWQIQPNKDRIPFDEWVGLDIAYIRNQSVWMDLLLIAKTVPHVLLGQHEG